MSTAHTAPALDVRVGPIDDRGRRLALVTAGGTTYRDRIDTDAGFHRQKFRERAIVDLGLPDDPDLHAYIEGELTRLADEVDATEPDGVEYRRLTSAELDAAEYDISYHVDGVLAAGQPTILAGPQKALKTSIMLDLAVALDRGGRFLGYFSAHPARVGVMTGESGLATVQETARRICTAAGCSLRDCGIIWSDTLPRFGSVAHADAVRRFIDADGLDVLAIDPAYLAMPGGDAGNLFAQGELLRSIADVAAETGTTLILLHHTSRRSMSERRPPELADIAWAGFPEFARQWLLVSRREPYEPGTGEHRLWLSVGGSAGHSGLWGLDVTEGTRDAPGGRVWDATVQSSGDLREAADIAKQQQAAERAQRKADRDRAKLREALRRFPQGETANQLRQVAGLSGDNFGNAIRALLAEGRAVACTVGKSRRKYDGFRPTEHT